MEYIIFIILVVIALILIFSPDTNYELTRWLRINIAGYKEDTVMKRQPEAGRLLTRIVGVVFLVIVLIGAYVIYLKKNEERYDLDSKVLDEVIKQGRQQHEDDLSKTQP